MELQVERTGRRDREPRQWSERERNLEVGQERVAEVRGKGICKTGGHGRERGRDMGKKP